MLTGLGGKALAQFADFLIRSRYCAGSSLGIGTADLVLSGLKRCHDLRFHGVQLRVRFVFVTDACFQGFPLIENTQVGSIQQWREEKKQAQKQDQDNDHTR